MANLDLSQFKTLFNQTSLEYYKKLDTGLKTLKQTPTNASTINEMHIASHSLKSQSLLMGYASLGNTALTLEKVFRSAKEGELILTPNAIEAIEALVTKIHTCLTSIANEDGEIDMTIDLHKFLQVVEEAS